MKIGGYNNFFQLDEKSNTERCYGSPCISPPRNSPLNISSLSSFSTHNFHSVGVTREGRGLAAGCNGGWRIIGTPQHFDLVGADGRSLKLVSAVCGNSYTLPYAHIKYNEDAPLFLNINSHNPIHRRRSRFRRLAAHRD